MVTDKDGFYTMKGYERSASDEMTSSMEDYLEMVCRMVVISCDKLWGGANDL